MHILLASATSNEISPTTQWLENIHETFPAYETSVLFTGIGGTAAAYAFARKFREARPDLVVQAGIAGSYSNQFRLGEVVLVKEEVFADLGAVENNGFTDIFDLGLAGDNERPFTKRMLLNPHIEEWKKYALRAVRGATVNCISSTEKQVAMITEKYNAQIESMEGAALHYACLMENIPFIQIRSISNFAGERDKSNWKIKESVSNLNKQLKYILEDQFNNRVGSAAINTSL
jgi:futalosine hydrolase